MTAIKNVIKKDVTYDVTQDPEKSNSSSVVEMSTSVLIAPNKRIEWRKICEINENSDIIHYVSQSMSPHPHRDYCLFRSWEKFEDGKCHLFITSTKHEKVF